MWLGKFVSDEFTIVNWLPPLLFNLLVDYVISIVKGASKKETGLYTMGGKIFIPRYADDLSLVGTKNI